MHRGICFQYKGDGRGAPPCFCKESVKFLSKKRGAGLGLLQFSVFGAVSLNEHAYHTVFFEKHIGVLQSIAAAGSPFYGESSQLAEQSTQKPVLEQFFLGHVKYLPLLGKPQQHRVALRQVIAAQQHRAFHGHVLSTHHFHPEHHMKISPQDDLPYLIEPRFPFRVSHPHQPFHDSFSQTHLKPIHLERHNRSRTSSTSRSTERSKLSSLVSSNTESSAGRNGAVSRWES